MKKLKKLGKTTMLAARQSRKLEKWKMLSPKKKRNFVQFEMSSVAENEKFLENFSYWNSSLQPLANFSFSYLRSLNSNQLFSNERNVTFFISFFFRSRGAVVFSAVCVQKSMFFLNKNSFRFYFF